MQSQGTRVFIVSLDGATLDVLRPLMNQGYMPNLAQLAQQGVCCPLESIIPPVTAPAWTSFMTGKHPGKHGIFDFVGFDVTDYKCRVNNSTNIRSKTLWQILSDKGKRVVALNLPFTYPTYPVNGVLVSGWDAPFLNNDFTYPEALQEEILGMIPDYAASLDLPLRDNWPTRTDELFERFTSKLMRGVDQGAAVSRHLLDREDWDVFMVHFQQTDWIQHNLWAYIARACNNSKDNSPRVEKVRKFYQHVDQAVGELLQAANKLKPVKIVLSDHGFGPHLGDISPNYFLHRWNYFATGSPGKQARASRLRGLGAQAARFLKKSANKMTRIGLAETRKFASHSEARLLGQNAMQRRLPVDWTRTKAAFVAGSEGGFIFVNRKGSSPLGMVEPGEQYEQLVSELIEKFRSARHPRTGGKLFLQVARGSDIYAKAASDVRLPDIVLIPLEGYGFSYDISAPVSDASAPEEVTHGSHRPKGVLLGAGPGLRQPGADFAPSLVDVAPTILHLIGLPVPTDMEGRVLQEMLTLPQPVSYEEVDNTVAQPVRTYNDDESGLVEERLKVLGYIE